MNTCILMTSYKSISASTAPKYHKSVKVLT